MFTTVAYYQDVNCAAAYTAINACADQHIRVSGKHIYMSDLNQIIGVYASGGGTTLGAYLDAPSLRRVVLFDIAPVQAGVTPSGDESFRMFPTTPLALMKNEGLDFYIKATDGSASHKFGIVWLADGPVVPVGGEIFTLQGDVTATGVAGTWVNGTISLRQTLPVGRYAVVGAACIGESLVAFRFVPVGALNRPGGLGSANLGAKGLDQQRYGGLGTWFEFDAITPPTIDILSNSTTSSHSVYLDLIKVA